MQPEPEVKNPPELPAEIREAREQKRQRDAQLALDRERESRRGSALYAAIAGIVALVTLPFALRAIPIALTAAAGGWVIYRQDWGRFRGTVLLGSIAVVNGFLWDWMFWTSYCFVQGFVGAVLGVARESDPNDEL